MEEMAGATMEEETGEMNVKDETTIVAAHLRRLAQFFGFSGSSAPFHVTWINDQYRALVMLDIFLEALTKFGSGVGLNFFMSCNGISLLLSTVRSSWTSLTSSRSEPPDSNSSSFVVSPESDAARDGRARGG